MNINVMMQKKPYQIIYNTAITTPSPCHRLSNTCIAKWDKCELLGILSALSGSEVVSVNWFDANIPEAYGSLEFGSYV